MFIDTHCHLSSEFYSDIPEVILEDEKAGMSQIIASFCEIDTVNDVCTFVDNYNIVYATIGFHPDQASKYTDTDLLKLRELCLKYKKIVGIGEIGLDYHYGKENRDEQIILFKKQLDLASELNLPVVIHSRDATKDTVDILKDYSLKGVIHCFSGSLEIAKEYIKLGFLLGIGGVVTFKNSKLPLVVKEIPLESIVLETDSPYLTPTPYRGSVNSSKYIPIIAEKIAEIKEISISEVASVTTNNALKLFDLDR
mgnify:CR=1 FL=1